jgi:AcrR family transcriptional regulator
LLERPPAPRRGEGSRRPPPLPSIDRPPVGDASGAARNEPRWARRKDARPAELRTAALDLFVERGYAATRLDDIAARAGVGKGTLYLYYPSKEALFKAVIQEGLVPLYEEGERLLEAHTGSAESLLRALLHTWWDRVGATSLGGIPKLMIAESGNFPEVTRYYVEEVMSRGKRILERALERGMERGEFRRQATDHTARLLMSPVVLMAVWRYSFQCFDHGAGQPADYIDLHIDGFMRGLRP